MGGQFSLSTHVCVSERGFTKQACYRPPVNLWVCTSSAHKRHAKHRLRIQADIGHAGSGCLLTMIKNGLAALAMLSSLRHNIQLLKKVGKQRDTGGHSSGTLVTVCDCRCFNNHAALTNSLSTVLATMPTHVNTRPASFLRHDPGLLVLQARLTGR